MIERLKKIAFLLQFLIPKFVTPLLFISERAWTTTHVNYKFRPLIKTYRKGLIAGA